jgi:hypothetical protein
MAATMRQGEARNGAAPQPTPSAELTRGAGSVAGVEYDADALGRRIGVKKPSAVDRMRVARMLGADSNNAMLFGYALLAVCVMSIDGETIPPPNSYREMESVIKRLDNEGCDCVGQILQNKFFIGPVSGEDAEQAVKNS